MYLLVGTLEEGELSLSHAFCDPTPLSEEAEPTLWQEDKLGPEVTEHTDGLLSLLLGMLPFAVLYPISFHIWSRTSA